MRRRDAMKAAALLSLTAACGGPSTSVRVVVVWSSWELTQFRRVLAAFPLRDRWRVEVQSAGNDLAAVVANRMARTAAPDVALIEQPQMVRANLRRLAPIDDMPGVPQAWENLLTFNGRTYGAWFKAAHKSIVWYRPDRVASAPSSWADWLGLCRDMAGHGHPPLAIGAADGWVLTDWFENVLLSMDPAVYRGLADGTTSWNHGSVRGALSRLAEMWTIPGLLPGGPGRALLTQFDGALVDVFAHGRAAMVLGADFFYPFIEQYGTAPARWFRFPRMPGGQPPLVVGGDAAVLLRSESEGGRALIRWLASPRAGEIWARAGGFLSLNPGVTGYPGDLSRLAADIREDTATPEFDLSDQLGGRLSGLDGRGTWKIFQDFFADVTDRPTGVEGAVRRTADALDRASRGQV
jgi:alpha-glucoside transport system substrate-binding protein